MKELRFMELPKKFEQKMKHLLQEEFDVYMASFDEERYYGLRANTLKVEPKELQDITQFQLAPIPWCKEGFYYQETNRPAKHPYYHAGLYYIQEPSAMTPGAILDVKPGDKVLDLCAAPGGKSTQIGAKLQQKGVLFSNDISATRVKALLKNIELAGITNAVVTNETPERLAERLEGYFDKILVDAPCSGEGMFRKEPDMIKSWESHGVDYCCDLQRNISPYAAKMLRPGGSLLYSTCTFSPEENEGMIEEFLSSHHEFEIVPIPHENGFDLGRPEWIGAREELKGCARLWPYKIKGEGHFVALLRKKHENGNEKQWVYPKRKINEKQLKDYNTFLEEIMNKDIRGNFELYGEVLCLLPDEVPDVKGLRVVRSGWHLGYIKKNRFEPSQALAMGLQKQDVKKVIDFSIDDSNVIRYLKGETLQIEGQKGWNLICVEGYPLGWGKIQNNMLKNKYLPGWRWMG
jgi:NOL1/NOP2/sun family putative RNA methylase